MLAMTCRHALTGACMQWPGAEAEQEDSEKGRETKESLEKAVAAVDKMLSAEQCAALVEAVVTKYVALTPEELQEWQVSQPQVEG